VSRFTFVILVILFGLSSMSGGNWVRVDREEAKIRQSITPIVRPTQTPLAFFETFDGSPDKPKPWNPAEWDIAVHSRDVDSWDQLEEMDASHGIDCSPAPSVHPITAYRDAVYQCRDHIMTAINASAYGVIYLTPNHMVDFSNGEAVIRFDMSTLRTSGRDWVDLWITPYEDNLQLPLSEWLPDLSGEPRQAVQIEMGFSADKTGFRMNIIRDFLVEEVPSAYWIGYEDYLTPSAMQRDTFELRISHTHVKFGMPAYDLWWVDEYIPALDWSTGVVQFGHHSYTPEKDCDDCAPNTWHWDNVEIKPAVPFTIIPARQRYADEDTRGRFNLKARAPENAYVRFSAVSQSLQISFDRGKSWQIAQPQAQKYYDEGPFWSYWMPIPSGTTQILFQGENWWGGNWRVKDLSVWSREYQEK
jgi:hypothetical protein